MTLFNHEIEYLPIWPDGGSGKVRKGTKIRSAVVLYDNLFGVRCEYRFHAPAHMWTKLVVGGMMSSGGVKSIGIITGKDKGWYVVQSADLGQTRYEHVIHTKEPAIGQQVIIFDAVAHDAGMFGQFSSVITNKLEIAGVLDVHSINIMVYNEDTHIGTVHIDPFTNMANYDEFKLVVGRYQWNQTEIERTLA